MQCVLVYHRREACVDSRGTVKPHILLELSYKRRLFLSGSLVYSLRKILELRTVRGEIFGAAKELVQ
jgi:hypothetical protein